jgi:hypothetical protein
MTSPDTRTTSFGRTSCPSLADRFGMWLSQRQIQRRTVGSLTGKES